MSHKLRDHNCVRVASFHNSYNVNEKMYFAYKV